MVQHIKMPTTGQKITVNKNFTLNVPDQPIMPYIEGDGTGVDITPVMIKVVDAAVAKAYRRQEEDRLDGGVCRRKINQGLWPGRVAARRNARRSARICRFDQGPADDAGGRRNSLDQRRAAAGTRLVCLPAPGSLFQRCAEPAERAGKDRHGDFPRKLGRYLCRDRIRSGKRQGEKADRVSAA